MFPRRFLTALLALALPVGAARAQSTACVSTTSTGTPSDNWSFLSAVSGDGRLVAFISEAANLVPSDTNANSDVFVKDLETGTITRVNLGPGNAQPFGGGSGPDGYWAPPGISIDGRYVVFVSAAVNLVPGDTNGLQDIFVRDRSTNTTARASVSAAGAQADGMSTQPAISANGRYVVFRSSATNLVPGDTNGVDDIFVKDLTTGAIERASVSSAEVQADNESWRSSISADGRYVAFESHASNLVGSDTNGSWDVFVRDRVSGSTSLISLTSTGAQANGTLESNAAISGDGRYVAFVSNSLVPADTNGKLDIYVRDLVGGTVTLVSLAASGALAADHCGRPRISSDGTHVVFESRAANLVAGDGNAMYDIFERDLVHGTTVAVSVDGVGATGNSGSLLSSVSADGRWVAFESDATNLVPGDANAVRDIFVREVWTPPPPPCLVRESLDTLAGDPDGPSSGAYVSGDGQWVAFASGATDLVFGDTNGMTDVFLRDRQGRFTELCSMDSSGILGDGPSEFPSVSADGRFVAFASFATNLVPGDTNGVADIFVHDRQLGAIGRISVSSAGLEADGPSYAPPWGGPSISPDGRYVAFCSLATNLVPGDTNGLWDVFVHDRDFDNDHVFDENVPGSIRTWRASVSSAGVEGTGDSGRYGLWLSAYGNFVTFQSFAGNLIPGDINPSDIFVHNNIFGSTVLINYDPMGVQAVGFHYLPSIAADLTLASDARYVTWASDSVTLVAGDGNGVDDIFVRDRALGVTSRVSVATGGGESDAFSTRSMVNPNGRYVVFDSTASNLDPDDGNFGFDVYVRDLQAGTTDLLSVPSGMGGSMWPTVDVTGAIVAFSSDSPGLVAGDTNAMPDVFVQDCNATLIESFCAPGVDGIVTCPCGNPQIPAGSTKGCNNFAGGGTGGAILAGSGMPSIASDTLAFQLTQGVASNVTVLFQGTTPFVNTRSGAGVRCVGGTLKRLYRGNQSAGSINFPIFGVPVHDASAAKGYTIVPPVTLYYYAAYRNSAANGQPGCPGLSFGFNTTNALSVPWSP